MAFTKLEPNSVNSSANFTFANVTASYYIGNGSQLTGIASGSNYSNANVTGYLPTYTGTFGTLSSLNINGLTTATGGVKTPNISDVSGTTTIYTKYNSVSGDVGIVGSLVVGTSGTGNISATNLTGNLTTAAQPNITSVGTLSGLTNTGWSTFYPTTDVIATPKTGATGTVTHDLSTGTVFYHSSIAANFTANFTNVPTTDNRTIVVTLILAQGATPYYVNACQIDGASQTIKWPSATEPTATANRTEFQSFTLIRVGSSWVVTGQLASYG